MRLRLVFTKGFIANHVFLVYIKGEIVLVQCKKVYGKNKEC